MNGVDRVPPEDILESLADAVFTVSSSWRITSFNKGAERMTGLKRRDVLGRPCHEVFRSSLCHENCPLRHSFSRGRSTVMSRAFITNNKDQQVLVNVSASLLRDGNNRVVGGVETFQDLRLLERGAASMEGAVQACEAQTLIAALLRNNNNRSAAARDLGIHKSTFFRKIKSLGIDLPEVDGRFRPAGPDNGGSVG